MDDYYPGKKHPSIQFVTGVRDVPRVCVKAKLITGIYILQVNRVAFNQNEISLTCLLCGEEDETIEHFILQCSALSDVRQSLLQEVRDIYLNLFHKQPDGIGCLLQFILDGGAILKDITRNSTEWILRKLADFCVRDSMPKDIKDCHWYQNVKRGSIGARKVAFRDSGA